MTPPHNCRRSYGRPKKTNHLKKAGDCSSLRGFRFRIWSFDVGNQTYEIEEYLEIKAKFFSKPVVLRLQPAFLVPIGKSLPVRLVNFRIYEKATENLKVGYSKFLRPSQKTYLSTNVRKSMASNS